MSIKNIRNIGICAHIDAGKTSLTERILFYCGKKINIGEVYNGEASMDWMDQEKERGITICSAVTTVFWSCISGFLGSYKINIIDTPGHVDFTAEVERSLRVLDGVCVVFCSVGGIQPQTETIWAQVKRYNIPSIGFVNKMDRNGADYDGVIVQISRKFNIIPLKLNIPVYKDGVFIGVIDLITLKKYIYLDNYGKVYNVFDVSSDDSVIGIRNSMIESIIGEHEGYFDKYFNGSLSVEDIRNMIRMDVLSCKVIPILCGSALKNRAIQFLLDAVVNFLPSPDDCKGITTINDNVNGNNGLLSIIDKKYLCDKNISVLAFVFKVINDEFSGVICFVRIYSGLLSVGDNVYISNKHMFVKIVNLVEIHADKKHTIMSASSGNIVGIIGFKNVYTGDTICGCNDNIILEPIRFPVPVISVSLSAGSSLEYEKLFLYIKKYSIEDPTIGFTIDNKSGKGIISGMGELHIDVFLERIRRISKVNFVVGKPIVAFRETIRCIVRNIAGKYIKQSGGRGQYGHVEINVIPKDFSSPVVVVDLIKNGAIPKEYIKIIVDAIIEFCGSGVMYGYPVVGVLIELVFGSYHEVDSSEFAFKKASIIAVRNAFNLGGVNLLEPIMLLIVYSSKQYLGILISDIVSRRGTIISIDDKQDCLIIIKSSVPMFELFNYSTVLRSKTKGRSTFLIEFNSYKVMPDNLVCTI